MASPTAYRRRSAAFHGRAAHAGIRPEDGRSAIVAAARAIAALDLGRLDEATTANVGVDRRRHRAARTSWPSTRRSSPRPGRWTRSGSRRVVAAMVDAVHDAANEPACACDVDVDVRAGLHGLPPQPGTQPSVVAAEAALRACGYTPSRIVDRRRLGRERAGGRRASPCTNLANGTERNHESDRARHRRRAGGHARRGARTARRARRVGEGHERPRLRAARRRDHLRGPHLHRAQRALPLRRRRDGGASARSSATPAPSASSPTTTSTSGSCASRARRSATRTSWRSPPGAWTRTARRRWRPPSASWPRRSARRPTHWEPLGSFYSSVGHPRRGGPPVPGDRPVRRVGADSGEHERIEIVRWPLRRPRRRAGRHEGLQDAHRAHAAARPPARGADADRRVARARGAPSGSEPPEHMTAVSVTRRAFEHHVLDFLAYLEFERGLSRNTLEAYRSDLLQLGAYLDARGRRRARRRAPATCAGFLSDLAAGGDERPPVAPATLQRKAACLRSFYRHLRRERGPRPRPDRRPARAAQDASACRRSSRATRSTGCSRAPRGTEPPRAARPRAARADVRLRPARQRGHRPRGRRPRPARPACCAPAARAPRSAWCPSAARRSPRVRGLPRSAGGPALVGLRRGAPACSSTTAAPA